MAMASENETERTSAIAEVITHELDRQAQSGAPRVDVPALASAIDAAIVHPAPAASVDEGKHPDELNSTNDD